MSYSYIKSVFPNFENSNKVYDETLYTNINSSLYNDSLPQDKPPSGYNENKKADTFILPSNKLLENLTNVNSNVNSNTNSTAEFKPQIPVKSQKQISIVESPPIESKVDILDKYDCDNCDTHIRHILNCKQCKMLAIKQLSIESDKYRNEEMMELASYVIFGMFILLLIDSLKETNRS